MATLTSTKIKNTYDALLKASDNDAIGSSAKQITDGLGNGTPLYISTTQIGIGVTPEATYDLHVYSNAKVGGNLTVTGDLTVEGTTTTIDTQTLTVEDPLIEVASNNTSTDAVDIGWYGKYAPSGTTLYAGLFRDTGDSKFKLFRNLEEQPTTTINTSGTGYTVATLVADVEGTLTGIIASSTTATTQSTGDNSTKVATTAYVDTTASNYLPLAGGTMSGSIAMGGNDISGAGTIIADSYIQTNNNFLTKGTLKFRNNADSSWLNGFRRVSGVDTLELLNISDINTNGGGAVTIGNDLIVDNELTVSGTGQSSFAGQVTIPETPSASTDAASKGYVDSQVGANNELSEVLANGNTTGGTDIAVSAGDDITFTDTSKAYFGTGNDLEIYHDGSTSDIWNYTGDLRIRNNSNDSNIDIAASDEAGTGSQVYIRANGSTGAAELFHYSYKKFETTSTGVTVTGDGTFTGDVGLGGTGLYTNTASLNIDGTGLAIKNDTSGSNNNWSIIKNTATSSGSNIVFVTGVGTSLTLNHDTSATFAGNIEVNGTLIDLDSSANATVAIDRGATNNDAIVSWRNAGSEFFRAGLENTDSNLWSLLHTCGTGLYFDGGAMTYGFNTSNAASIDSASGIGTVVVGAGGNSSAGITIYTGSSTYGALNFADATSGTGAYQGYIKFDHSDNSFGHYIGNVERMRIDSSGRVGINETSLSGNDAKLIIDSGDGKHPAIKVNDGGANGFTMLADNYTATESQFNIGVGYSGGQGVISHNCKVSDTADNVFLSSNGQGATKPMALSFDAGDFIFRNTNTSATTAVDTVVTLTERMRITSDGHALIGVQSITDATTRSFGNAFSGTSAYPNWKSWGSGSHTHAQFRNGTNVVGSITTTSSATAYNTSSDYRLKENVVEMTGALDRVSQLKPSRFNFIGEEKTVDGFLAHEVQDIVPEAITGEKDATYQHLVSEAVEAQDAVEWTDKPTLDNTKVEIQEWLDDNEIEWQSADTKQELLDRIPEYQQEAVEAQDAVYETRPEYQGIDQSKLVPLLVGAIQELKAEIESLKQQINN